MSSWPILLRALLSISLILNGFGNAAASTHMPIAHAAGHAAKSQPAEQAMAMTVGSCGHARGSDGSASAPGKSAAGIAAASHDSTIDPAAHATPDCCDSRTCSCACAHQAQATIAACTLRNVPVEHPRSARRLQPGHASPALPHLIRPPIG